MKFIGKSLIPWASCLLLTQPQAQTQTLHIAHCLIACPEVSDRVEELLVRHLFVAAIIRDTGAAEWVAYRVLADSVGLASLLPRYWQNDPMLLDSSGEFTEAERIPVERLSAPGEAGDTEYRTLSAVIDPEDRGRLAPLSSFAGTPYWEELNNFSNLAALPPSLRVGSWARLEIAVNEIAASHGEVFVVAGSLPDDNFFKVIRSASGQASFIFPPDLAPHAPHCAQASTLADIEQRLGLTLFPADRSPTPPTLLPELGCVD